MDLKEKLIKDYNLIEDNKLPKSSSVRQRAKEQFELTGFPNRKMEEWRFTDIKKILNADYKQVIQRDNIKVTREDIDKLHFPRIDANFIVIVNGKYSKELSKVISDKNKIVIENFSKVALGNPAFIEKHFSKYADFTKDGFTALNTAYGYDGAVIKVNKNSEIKEPVIILNINDTREKSVLSQTRNIISVEENSNVTVCEMYFSLGVNEGFSNVVSEIHTDVNSEIHYYKIQNEGEKQYHVGTTQVSQESNSRFFGVTVTFGGDVIRNNLNSILSGEGIECIMKGLYYTTGKQIVDNHTLADHAFPNCHSNELYKGILDDNSNAAFNGKIMVRKDAQKTNAYQMNKNILLTNEALINTKPQLEIYADDVKCSHGATTGQIDDEQLFYLQARGIGKKEARKLLLYAFANEVLEEIEVEPVKIFLEEMLEDKLAQQ